LSIGKAVTVIANTKLLPSAKRNWRRAWSEGSESPVLCNAVSLDLLVLRAVLKAKAPKCENHNPAEPTARTTLATSNNGEFVMMGRINATQIATTIKRNDVLAHFWQRPR
jgi:hypothetical protein